jgi:hypothetical protein
MLRVNGVAEKKFQLFGEQFLELFNNWQITKIYTSITSYYKNSGNFWHYFHYLETILKKIR